ncbi:hypothetical protein [Nocardioides montaniterrae]
MTNGIDLANPTGVLADLNELNSTAMEQLRHLYAADQSGDDVPVAADDRGRLAKALWRLASRYEEIGDECRDLSDKLLHGATVADPTAGATVLGPTLRELYGAFEGTVDAMSTLLRSNADEMHRVSEKCLVAFYSFEGPQADPVA